MSHNSDRDWVLQNALSVQIKDSLIICMETLIKLARCGCEPALTFDELQDYLEAIWYEME